MRYAIISDIHGNIPALKAVLDDAARNGVERYVFAGDYYLCSPFPNEAINISKNIKNSYAIRGNHEDYLSNLSTQDSNSWTDGQFSALYWAYREITQENYLYLHNLSKVLNIKDTQGTNIYLEHSSKDLFGDIEMEIGRELVERYKKQHFSKEDKQKYYDRALPLDKAFQEVQKQLAEGIYVFGHSHIQWHYFAENKLFINPGACGLPLDFETGAPYTILDIDEERDIKWTVEERRIEYDIKSQVEAIKGSPLYSEARVMCNVIIRELETGRQHLIPFLNFAEDYANRIGDQTRPFSKETWEGAYNSWKEEKL